MTKLRNVTPTRLPDDWDSGLSREHTDVIEKAISTTTNNPSEAPKQSLKSRFLTKLSSTVGEIHLPGGYQFCGPGTKVTKRLKRGDRGINILDKACREHDKAYMSGDTEIMRQSDTVLKNRAKQIFDNTTWKDAPKLKASAKFVQTGFQAIGAVDSVTSTISNSLNKLAGLFTDD